MEKVHRAACLYALKKSPQCASRAKTRPLHRRPLTARPKRPIISRRPLWICCANCAKTLTPRGLETKIFIAVGDGSFCNKTTFRQPLDRTILITRARKDLRLCFPHQAQGPRYYGTELFSPEKVSNDPTIPWKETKIFHGSKYRKIRFKEVSQVLWQRGGGRRLLRLFVLAPTPYRKTKEGRRYYRQKAYLLCDDNQLAAKELLQAYFDRWQIEINHRDEKNILGVGHAQVWAELSLPRVPAMMVATYSLLLLSALGTYAHYCL